MRICMYTEEPFPRMGGKAAVIDALARQYQALGHEVVILATHLRHGAAPTHGLPYPLIRHPRFYSQRWFVDWYRWWLARAHREHQFDIVHCHSVHPTGYVAACCRALSGVPLVITSHGDVCSRRFSWQKNLAERYRLVLERADAAIAISGFLETRFLELAPQARRIVRIPNGVEIAAFAEAVARPADLEASLRPGEYLLFLGRLVPRKGIDVLLNAFARMTAPGPLQLVIAGEGDSRAELVGQAQQLGIAERVRFVGRVEGPGKAYLYQNALCTVVPSRSWEGFPLVPLESYAAGRPVIATALPAMRDVVVPEQTGLLVACESAVELAEALDRAVLHPDWLDRLGQQARQFVRDYDWSTIAQRHLALYAEVAGSRRRAA